MEPRLRASQEQFSVLIDFMERHGDLSRPQSGPQGRLRSDRLWQELTNILNSLGGGVQKSSDKWKKVWADWKTKTKKKYLSLRLQASGTGGGPSNRMTLTALEERVVAVIGVTAVVGQPGVQEQGFNRTSTEPGFEVGSGVELPQEHALDIVFEDHSQNVAVATPASPAVGGVPAATATLPRPQHLTPNVVLATPETAAPLSPPSPPPPRPSPPPPPRTPPARNTRRRREASASPRSTATTPRRALLRARRNRGLTPFERATDRFAAIEKLNLEHKEAQDRRLHEREMERLRLEAKRIEVDREHNLLLQQLSCLGQRLIDVITQQRPGSLPSTDPI